MSLLDLCFYVYVVAANNQTSVASRFITDIQNTNVFFTDSNGIASQQRITDPLKPCMSCNVL